MKYIALDIDGWLGGTCARFLTKSEKAIWSDLIVLGGKGKGRFGFIELQKGVPYSRQQLLSICQCFTDEDIAIFDSCFHKCLNGTAEGDYIDAPRLEIHGDGIYEIINWDKYQHSDFPKGLTEEEAKALKKTQADTRREETQLGKEINQGSFIKHTLDVAIDKAKAVNSELAEEYLDQRCKPTTKELRAMNKKLKKNRDNDTRI